MATFQAQYDGHDEVFVGNYTLVKWTPKQFASASIDNLDEAIVNRYYADVPDTGVVGQYWPRGRAFVQN